MENYHCTAVEMQVEALEDALKAEQALTKRYERGVKQYPLLRLDQENSRLANQLAGMETHLSRIQQELEASKAKPTQAKLNHSRKKSILSFSQMNSENFDKEQILQSQVKSLQDLCASQEKMIQKCVESLQSKKHAVTRYRQRVALLEEEKQTMQRMGSDDEDLGVVSVVQSPRQIPRLRYLHTRRESLSLFQELGGSFNELCEAQPLQHKEAVKGDLQFISPEGPTHLKDSVNADLRALNVFHGEIMPDRLNAHHHQNAVSSCSDVDLAQSQVTQGDVRAKTLTELNRQCLSELKQTVAAANELLKSCLAKVKSPRTRQHKSMCLLSELTKSQAFTLL
jgi:chromosome segregation ATPase